MNNIVMPDFVEWSKHIFDRVDVMIALEQAFNQGRALGHREGFQDGKLNGWIQDIENDPEFYEHD